MLKCLNLCTFKGRSNSRHILGYNWTQTLKISWSNFKFDFRSSAYILEWKWYGVNILWQHNWCNIPVNYHTFLCILWDVQYWAVGFSVLIYKYPFALSLANLYNSVSIPRLTWRLYWLSESLNAPKYSNAQSSSSHPFGMRCRKTLKWC